MTQRTDGPLLQLRPRDRLMSERKALLRELLLENLPVYELLREPTDVDELHLKTPDRLAIWRENGTVSFIGRPSVKPSWERRACFTIGIDYKNKLQCDIYVETDAAIAETAAFILSLKDGEDVDTRFCDFSYSEQSKFDFAVLRSEQFVRILDANQKRHLRFPAGIFSA